MSVELTIYSQENITEDKIYNSIYSNAQHLLNFLNKENILDKINEVNKPGASSAKIQEVLLEEALKIGFNSEKKGLFSHYKTSALRPDYYKKVENTGILLEVERGKTIHNNMDLLDIWKCHICEHADYLFLLVPKALRQNNKGSSQNTYLSVCNRLDTFFEKNNYINVKAVFIFGY